MTKSTRTIKVSAKAVYCIVSVAALCCLAGASQALGADDHSQHTQQQPATGIHLSHDLKDILNEEMNAIEQAMMAIIPAIASGDWKTITSLAQKIKDSFILKQKLTSEQMNELHHSLPGGFIEMDQKFHKTAGKLAHAAHESDGELVNFYYSKLHNQCMNCHATYASERFTGLKSSLQAEADQH